MISFYLSDYKQFNRNEAKLDQEFKTEKEALKFAKSQSAILRASAKLLGWSVTLIAQNEETGDIVFCQEYEPSV